MSIDKILYLFILFSMFIIYEQYEINEHGQKDQEKSG